MPANPAQPTRRPAHNEHVAIVDAHTARLLQTGRKRIESRFASTRRRPLGSVHEGDEIHFKQSGGDFIGTCFARQVREFTGLTPAAVQRLYRRYNALILAPSRYWHERRHRPYAVLIWITPLMPLARRVHIPRQYGNGWLTLPQPRARRNSRIPTQNALAAAPRTVY
jgi:hypothetical protein